MITPALGKKNKLANNVTVRSRPTSGNQRQCSQSADAVKRVLADRSLNIRRGKRVFLSLALRFTNFYQLYLGKFCLKLEVERTRLLAKPAVFKMPKSFLVKNKKARRAEDEIQDSTKAAQGEDKPPGKGKLQTSLQAKIALVPVST